MISKLVKWINMILLVTLVGCGDSSPTSPSGGGATTINYGIGELPQTLPKIYRDNFAKYTSVTAPNGKPIHIVAQDQLTVFQIVKAKNLLSHYLNNFDGSEYGSDKSSVANSMANNNAFLLLCNGSDDGNNPIGELEIDGQPLFYNELVPEGSSWYLNCDFENHRDASYEEILHLVHDYGIGVDDINNSGTGTPGALVDSYQLEIREATQHGMANNLWPAVSGWEEWIEELTAENSLTQEYLASVIDSYYGLWGSWNEAPGGMWGGYIAKNRDEVAQLDSKGFSIVEKFFTPHLTYTALLDSSLIGTFSLKFDPSIPYTHNSRYLKDIELTGDNDVDIIINSYDNFITGNSGENRVFFSGNYDQYTISKEGDYTIITDSIENRDGVNRLLNIETAKFIDQSINL